MFFLYAQKVKTNLKGSDVFRSIFGYIDTYTTSDPGVSVIHKDHNKMLMVIYWLKSLEPSGFSCFEIVYNGQNMSFENELNIKRRKHRKYQCKER